MDTDGAAVYERMKYGHDRRAWVKAADEQVPEMLGLAAEAQQLAARCFASYQVLPSDYMRNAVAETYRDARMFLFRAIYYQGMRRANLDE